MAEERKWQRVDAAFAFLSAKAKAAAPFSLDEIIEATGWTESSVRTYLTERWRAFTTRADDKWLVGTKFLRLTREAFRAHHSQTSAGLERLYDALVEKSIAAAISAIEVYNKPDFRYRAENFAALMTNAWELLLKARILLDNDDQLDVLFARDKNGEPMKSKSGANRTITILAAAKTLRTAGVVNDNLLARSSASRHGPSRRRRIAARPSNPSRSHSKTS